jgi:hypothetical protein
MSLVRLSERVSPTGGLHADGFANILGRPALDPLTLVLREAAQNIWDARNRAAGAPGPRMLVRVRVLDAAQSDVFRQIFSGGDARSAEPVTTNELSRHLALAAPIRVLEISDFGTMGLAGGTDPTADQGNFVRFFFDVGTAHMGGGDGGTYGYGRSSLYLAGPTRTILVDSQVQGENVRRLMACRLGPAYTKPRLDGGTMRYTGRHFWGGEVQGDRVLPLGGEAAGGLAESLGMPGRGIEDSGTTILVPWPDLPQDDTGRRIALVLLHNLWPKLVELRGKRPMAIEVQVDGVEVAIPSPKRHPQYAPFAAALALVRNPDPVTGVIPVAVTSAHTVTGHLAIQSTHAAPVPATPQSDDAAAESDFSHGIHHIALMRPSELVVRYQAYPGVAPDTQWGGVFMCSDEPRVRDAFAASEPPAHDDWVPDRLADQDKTLVRVSLRRIREHVDRHFGVGQSPVVSGDTGAVSLAAAADRFAAEFLSGEGSAAAETGGGIGGGGGGGKRPLDPLRFDSVRLEEGRTIARFFAECGAPLLEAVRASAWVVTGGRGGDPIPEDISPPVVIGWTKPGGEWVPGASCSLTHVGRYLVDVAFEGRYAIDARWTSVESFP